MYLIMLLLLVVGVSLSYGQTPFTPADRAMDPALESGTSYAVASKDSLRKGYIVVFKHGEKTLARRVAGVPGDKILAADPSFAVRKGYHLFHLYQREV